MHYSAYDLKRFYSDRKGRIIQDIICQKITGFWSPDAHSKQHIIGYGYALPYLLPFMMQEDQNRIAAMIPQQLGVHQWPDHAPNNIAIHPESMLPLETNSVDMIIMIHALEFSETPHDVFDEMWRVLKSTGKLLVIVPNRVGFWVRAEWSPFGQGQPYSQAQILQLLDDTRFVHERTDKALFVPPFKRDLLIQTAHFFEKFAPSLCPAFASLHVIEASKQIYATRHRGTPELARVPPKVVVKTKPVPNPRG